VRWFLPKSNQFLDSFNRSAENIVAGVALFRDLLTDVAGRPAKVEKLKDLEHQGDRITHETLARLNTTFITPFDREDIHALITKMDDILDAADAAASRLIIYRVGEPTDHLVKLADLLVESAGQVHEAVITLHDRRRRQTALKSCVEINRLENEADTVHRRALAELFSGATEPIQLIKLKELYTFMEEATDRCEDVANVIESIIIKGS